MERGGSDLKYSAILIDADDTLFDFHKAETYALEATFADHRIDLPLEGYLALFREINTAVWSEYESGQSTPEIIRTKRFVLLLETLKRQAAARDGASDGGLPAGPGGTVDPLAVSKELGAWLANVDAQSMSDAYIGHLSEASHLIDGAVELLETLRGTVPLVMLTNGLSSVQRPRFARAHMERYFNAVVISEEVGSQKPDPRIFQIALTRAAEAAGSRRIAPADAIMIGDNLNSDIKGAMDAGLDACWFNYRGKTSDGVQPTFSVTALNEIPGLLGL